MKNKTISKEPYPKLIPLIINELVDLKKIIIQNHTHYNFFCIDNIVYYTF